MKNKPHWKLTEEVVALIERHISPNSVVRHNVEMPDLSGDSDTRQCDIVIWTGKPPRQTVTIVEVQDRTKPFNITFFDGLLEKMRRVGAQHLICVSRKDFPASIKIRAKRLGSTVRLVTMRMLEAALLPIEFLDNRVVINTNNIDKVIDSKLELEFSHGPVPPPEKIPLSQNDKVFLYNGILFSIGELILGYLNDNKILLSDGIHQVKFELKHQDQMTLEFVSKDGPLRVRMLSGVAEITHSTDYIPLTYATYQQTDSTTPLVWIAEARGWYLGQEISIKGIVEYKDDGFYRFKIVQMPDVLQKAKVELIIGG